MRLKSQPASQPDNKRRYEGYKAQVIVVGVGTGEGDGEGGKGQIGLAIRLV